MLIKNTILYLAGNIVNRIGAFLLLPIYTTHLTVSEYGTLELIYSIISVLSIILGAGLSHTTLRFYFDNDDEKFRNSVITTNAITTTIIATVVGLILSFNNIGINNLLFNSKDSLNVVPIISAIIVFELTSEIHYAYIRAEQKVILYVLVSSIKLLTQLSVSIYLVVYLDMSILGVLLANLFCVFVVWAYLSLYVIKNCGIHFNFEILLPIFKYALPFALASLIGVLLTNSDKLLIRYFIGLEDLGLYGLAMKFALMLSFVLLDPIQKSYGPYRFAIMRKKNSNSIYSGLALLILDLSCVAVLLLICFLPYVVKFMADQAYWGAVSYIPMLLLGVLFQAVNYNMQTGILINKKTKYLLVIIAIVTLFNIVLNYLFIPLYGLYAASIVYMSSYFLMTVLTFMASQKERYIDYKYLRMVLSIGFLIFLSLVAINNDLIIKITVLFLYVIYLYLNNNKEHLKTIALIKNNT